MMKIKLFNVVSIYWFGSELTKKKRVQHSLPKIIRTLRPSIASILGDIAYYLRHEPLPLQHMLLLADQDP